LRDSTSAGKKAHLGKKETGRGAAFTLAAATAERVKGNCFQYDECASGRRIYSYVGGNPVRWIDPLGLYKVAPGVSEGLRIELHNALMCFEDCIRSRMCSEKFELTITSGTEGHPPNDPHTRGEAVDIGRNSNPNLKREDAVPCFDHCFPNAAYAQEERNSPRYGGTHFHFQINPGLGGIIGFRQGVVPYSGRAQ
jgi:hypothetical protein